MLNFPYKRIVIVGTTSSGKSTLAEKLAGKLGYDFIELDALHWEPSWEEAPLVIFRERVEKTTQAESWVVAGNYRVVRDLIWAKAEAVIWLDYSLWRIFWQLTRRTFARWWKHEHLWGTNYEDLSKHFKLWSQESLFHWLFKTYWRRKREYPMLFAMPEYQNLKLFHFKRPHETNNWLNGIQGTHHEN
jgi:adenylate kinase family enzyme